MTHSSGPLAPDADIRRLSIEKYRRHAQRYDHTLGPTSHIRQQAVDLLRLRPGMRVLDVGCGTGASLPLLADRVGASGQVVGFDQSPEMLARARVRAAESDWSTVQLLECSAQELKLDGRVDAFLFHYTHDILQSRTAIEALFAHATPGARIAIAGICYFPLWLAPLNLWVYLKNRPYNGRPGGLRRPWQTVQTYLEDWSMARTQFGMGYLASGRVRPRP